MEPELIPDNNKSNEKIVKVLQKFLEPNFKVRNDVYLNLFLTHLIGKEGKKVISNDWNKLFSDWLIKASTLWDTQKVTPPGVILSFALNLASQLSADEQVFVKLNSQNVYESLAGIAQKNLDKDASVTLGLVTLLCAFLEHKSGVQWVLATAYWRTVMNLGLHAHTMYIRKKAYEFVAKLLKKTICFNRDFCLNLIDLLLKPLREGLRTLANTAALPPRIQNNEFFELLKPSLVFISEVMEILLKGVQTAVLNLFIEFKSGDIISKLLLLSQIEDLSFELIKIRCILLFSKLGKEQTLLKKDGVIRMVAQDSITLFDIKTMFDVIQDEMDKDHVRCVIKVCHYAHTLYCSVACKMPLCIRKGEPIEFQNQMVLFQIMPILIFLSDKRDVAIDTWLSNVFRRDFIQRLVKMSAIRTLEICFKWKERLLIKPDLIEDMTFGLQYMIKTKKFLNKEQASIFFQPLVYSLRDMLTLKGKDASIKETTSVCLFLQTLIENIIDLVQSFDLTWRDSIETISVMSIACEFLQCNHWEPKLVVAGLKLLNLAVSKYMSPDMVLLMDNSKDTPVSQTGTLLYSKCLDMGWEIRDTALENVYTLSLNANSKFPSYTNILVEAELPQLVVQMAFKDTEYYVRATAFRCLQEMVQVQAVWDTFMEMDKFLEQILDVFGNETEGVVRKEAATLVFKIQKYQSFPDEMLPRLYDVMTHAAIGDLHWEVKCNALDYWFSVCQTHLSLQGMIDCTFPTVTFSIEHRKIVTLNETEIRKRLIKVLNQMSSIGCLYVLKQACLDDCDIEVSRKAVDTTAKIVTLLQKYKVPCENIDMSESPPAQNNDVPSPASSTTCTAYSPDCGDVPSPQFTPSIFDAISPFSVPLSPSLNLDLISPSSVFSPLTPPSTNDTAQYSPTALTQQVSPSNVITPILADQDMDNIIENGIRNNHLPNEDVRLKHMNTERSFDPLKADSVLEELLNSNDMSFLQKIYNPSDQVQNTQMQMKRSTYLAPSDYLKFIYYEVEAHATNKTNWINSLDEFDSLLDDILKEYNVTTDVNSMDCY